MHSLSLVSNSLFARRVVSYLASDVALPNVNHLSTTLRVVIRGKISLCLGIEHQVVAQWSDQHFSRLFATELLGDHMEYATSLPNFITVVDGLNLLWFYLWLFLFDLSIFFLLYVRRLSHLFIYLGLSIVILHSVID